jgi:hypothetical protein
MSAGFSPLRNATGIDAELAMLVSDVRNKSRAPYDILDRAFAEVGGMLSYGAPLAWRVARDGS